MTDISLAAAAGAGLISFLSPCVLPLAPPYLCYLAGTSVEALADESEKRARADIVIASLLFVAGFATVFVALGATASVFGALLRQWSHVLSIVAGLGIIVMGAHFLGLFRLTAMLREARLDVAKPPGLWSAYLMGLAFAFGWTPCIGPILAAILAVAGAQDTVARGALLLAAYAFGLGVPFVVAAIAMESFLGFARGFRRHFARLEKVVGALLVITGVGFLTGGFQAVSTWLIEAFPNLGQLG
ncbi:MAG: sulfite exporter TauE/SafE family protein [Hyphomicrobiales bacterium]|nr:sulfite exporter TauE/SafE family protein [Hyphomicrobiales bacterium]